ncbi:hypothetical protein [Maricaulis sp.]|nr:hypothetical protein [Maricaulis sp.]
MFTKEKRVGTRTDIRQRPITAEVTDWGEVFGFIFWVFLVLAVIKGCTGG